MIVCCTCRTPMGTGDELCRSLTCEKYGKRTAYDDKSIELAELLTDSLRKHWMRQGEIPWLLDGLVNQRTITQRVREDTERLLNERSASTVFR